jgi:hypothetical protein
LGLSFFSLGVPATPRAFSRRPRKPTVARFGESTPEVFIARQLATEKQGSAKVHRTK